MVKETEDKGEKHQTVTDITSHKNITQTPELTLESKHSLFYVT